MNQHIGSDFDDFLREEGIFAEVEAAAIKKVIACMITEAMEKLTLTKVRWQHESAHNSINCLIVKNNKNLIPTVTDAF